YLRPLDGLLPLEREPEVEEECLHGFEVVDDDEDVVHPLHGHGVCSIALRYHSASLAARPATSSRDNTRSPRHCAFHRSSNAGSSPMSADQSTSQPVSSNT